MNTFYKQTCSSMKLILYYYDSCIHVMKPDNKNQKLGTLGDFEFVVDYASTISLDTVFKIS